MDRARPTNNTVHDVGIGVTYQLYVYRVVIFPVDVFVLVIGRGSDLNVRAVDATDNVRKVRHGMEHDFMASVSRCGWKRTCLGTSRAKAAATRCIVLEMVALLTPNISPTTNWKLPHTKNRNAIRTWSVGVSVTKGCGLSLNTRSRCNPLLASLFSRCTGRNAAILKVSKKYLVDLRNGGRWRRLSSA